MGQIAANMLDQHAHDVDGRDERGHDKNPLNPVAF
jgi:hypothetical protein